MSDESPLYNTDTRQPESLPFEQIPQAILSGTHSYKSDAAVNVIDDSGQSYSLPSTQLKDALTQGYQLENPKQTAIRQAVQDNDSLSGSAKVALRSFGDELGLGVPEILRRHGQDDFERAKEEAVNQSHPFANFAGSAAGFLGSLAVTDGLGILGKVGKVGDAAGDLVARQLEAQGIKRGSESAAKDLTARIATNAAKLGAEGVMVSTPRAVTEASLGDPMAAAESLLAGGVMGGVLGAGAGTLSKPWEALIEKLSAKGEVDSAVSKSWLDKFRNEKAQDALGFTKQARNRYGTEKSADIADYILNSRTEDGEKLIGLRSDQNNLDMIQKFNDEANTRLDQAYTKLDDVSPAKVAVEPMINDIKNDIATKYNLNLNSAERGVLEDIVGDLDTVRKGGTEMGVPRQEIGFGEARDFLQKIKDVGYPAGRKVVDPTPRQLMAREAYFKLRSQVDQAAENAAKQMGDQSLLDNLTKSRKDVAMSIPAIDVLKKSINRAGNKGIGLTDMIAAGTTATGFGVLPAAGAVAVKKLVEKYGDQALANLDFEAPKFIERAMKNVGQRLDQVPDAINGMSRIGQEKNVKAAALNQILNLRKDEGPDQIKKVKERAHMYVGSPERLIDDVSQHLAPLERMGAPNVAQALGIKAPQVMDYIQQIAPKPLTPPNPFQQSEWKPSDQQKAKFERQLSVIMDPMSVVDDLRKGTLTQDQMETLSTVYPVIYKHIQTRALSHLMDKKPKLSYQSRLKLSMLLGFNMDNSVDPGYMLSLQDNFQYPAETPEPGSKMTFADSAQPETQEDEPG